MGVSSSTASGSACLATTVALSAQESRTLSSRLNDWHLFVEEWITFRGGAGWFARTTGATYDKALDYRKRADAWDELIRRRGASSAPVGTTPAAAPKGDLIGSVVKLAGIGIGALAAAPLFAEYIMGLGVPALEQIVELSSATRDPLLDSPPGSSIFRVEDHGLWTFLPPGSPKE